MKVRGKKNYVKYVNFCTFEIQMKTETNKQE